MSIIKKLINVPTGKIYASRIFSPIEIAQEESIRDVSSSWEPLREYKMLVRIGALHQCKDVDLEYAQESVKKLINYEVYGDLLHKIYELKHYIRCEDRDNAMLVLNGIIEEYDI